MGHRAWLDDDPSVVPGKRVQPGQPHIPLSHDETHAKAENNALSSAEHRFGLPVMRGGRAQITHICALQLATPDGRDLCQNGSGASASRPGSHDA